MQISLVNFKNIKYGQPPQNVNNPAGQQLSPYNNGYYSYSPYSPPPGPRPYNSYYRSPYGYSGYYSRMMPMGYYGMMPPPMYMRLYNPYMWYPFDNYEYISRFKDADIRRQLNNTQINDNAISESDINNMDDVNLDAIEEPQELTLFDRAKNKFKDISSSIINKFTSFFKSFASR